MFDHVEIRVADRDAAERFYDTVLGAIGVEKLHSDGELAEWGELSLAAATAQRPPTRGLHLAFFASGHDAVEAFWRAGIDAGYRDDGPPGRRPQYGPDYYGAFLLDPDGNSAEAVHHGADRTPGRIDHLWIRVADLGAARRFYATIAPFAGLEIGIDESWRTQFVGSASSFMLVSDDRPPTEHVHLAFPATDHATVEAFWRAGVEAGYRDNGGPGERPEYHAGYYGAFVLDPDGHNVEVVDHGR